MRTRSLAEAKSKARTCQRCSLWKGRTQVVYGVGDHDADLMFIGEGPGKCEDQKGEPFVGDSGKLLNRMLAEIELSRDDVYITNVVQCRPQKNQKNRHPYADEIEACAPWLDEQIRLVDPKLIVPLGNVAMRRFRDRKDKIGEVHGRLSDWDCRTIVPTFHPAWILRGGPNSQRMQTFREDFATIRAALDSG